MTETEEKPREPEPPTRAAEALATSVPDDNHLLMQMIRLILGRHGLVGSFLAGVIMLVWVMAKWGVPAILAASQLILQLHGDQVKERDADRAIEQQQLQATQGVQGTLNLVSGKLDAQATKLTQLGADVDAIKQRQASADQRMGRLSAEQAAQARRIEEKAHGAP